MTKILAKGQQKFPSIGTGSEGNGRVPVELERRDRPSRFEAGSPDRHFSHFVASRHVFARHGFIGIRKISAIGPTDEKSDPSADTGILANRRSLSGWTTSD